MPLFKVCGQGDFRSDSGRCCVAHKMASTQDNYVEGEIDVFAGPDSLSECYNFDLGDIQDAADMSELFCTWGSSPRLYCNIKTSMNGF